MSPRIAEKDRAELPKPVVKKGTFGHMPLNRLSVSYVHRGMGQVILGFQNKEENLPILDQFFFLGNITGVDTTSPLGNNIPSDPLSLGLDKPSFQSTNFDMSSGQTGRRSQQRSIRTFGRQARVTQSPSGQGGSY